MPTRPVAPPPLASRQDDLLYATLTVQETLHFAAMLRLPKRKPKAEKVGGSWFGEGVGRNGGIGE